MLSRREAIAAVASATLASNLVHAADGGQRESGTASVAAQVKPSQHVLAPLPFNPGKLKGLSEKLLRSHHENNYGGAVKNLNKVEEELARVGKDTPGFIVSGLKERELVFTNSIILHEHYFGNLGGNGKAPESVRARLARAFGSFARWEEEFRATGGSLAGGSGWVILDQNFHTGALRTYWSGNHSQAVSFGQPLLVMDMYEHAYAIDYGAGAARYIDAFFQNIQWEEVQRRMELAERLQLALK